MGEKFPPLCPIVKTNHKNIQNNRPERLTWDGQGQGNREADQGDDWSARPKKLARAGKNRRTGKPIRGEAWSAGPKSQPGAGKDRKLEELAEITGRNIGRGE